MDGKLVQVNFEFSYEPRNGMLGEKHCHYRQYQCSKSYGIMRKKQEELNADRACHA